MDRAAASRALSHGADLKIRYENRFPSNAPSYEIAVSCEATGSPEQREAALADLRSFQTPAPVPSIEGWLAELSVITAGKGPDGFDAELLVTAYSSRLSQYPADVVRHALLKKTWKWFPTWDELQAICEAKASPRRHMIAALSKPAPDQAPSRRAPTQEERDRIQALVDDMFPQKSSADRKAAVDIALQGDCMSTESGGGQ